MTIYLQKWAEPNNKGGRGGNFHYKGSSPNGGHALNLNRQTYTHLYHNTSLCEGHGAMYFSHRPSLLSRLGEELRPVQLKQVVLGYPCSVAWSEFRFDISLTYKLPSVVATYSDNKPTLVGLQLLFVSKPLDR